MVSTEVVGMDADLPAGAVVLVVDVIRAFTTAAVAFRHGAAEILCVPTADAGRALRAERPDHLLMGETGGLPPADFDLGNSPAAIAAASLAGRRIIQATSNGTRGLFRAPRPAALLAVSAVNVGATARWVAARHPGTPRVVLCTGRSGEDQACGHHLRELLEGGDPDPAGLVAGIMAGVAEQARRSLRYPPAERVDLGPDVPFCRAVDSVDFAMVGERRDGHVRLVRLPPVTASPGRRGGPRLAR